jgi:hypothetical protein
VFLHNLGRQAPARSLWLNPVFRPIATQTPTTAFAAHPKRFKGLAPKAPAVPTAVWINPPIQEIAIPEIIIPGSLNSSSLVSQIN